MKSLKTIGIILGWFILMWGVFYLENFALAKASPHDWFVFPTFFSGVVIVVGGLFLSLYLIIEKIWKKTGAID